jgi:hypothetical protein
MAAICCFMASNLSSSIAMVVFKHLASLSNSGGGADLLGASRGGRNRTFSMERRGGFDGMRLEGGLGSFI